MDDFLYALGKASIGEELEKPRGGMGFSIMLILQTSGCIPRQVYINEGKKVYYTAVCNVLDNIIQELNNEH